ncbi:hypothetical protein [Rhodohalobacter halophilus]|uniref:hypothetical protein n=1 Tax=Rhodohalobacter halophilus TaxID=1812810 RepID=UPI00083FBDC1|nr:hypothetical protein [Rhodohalobacter halophilus]
MAEVNRKLVIATTVIAAIFIVVGLFLPSGMMVGWYTGYFIGLMAVVLHLGASIFSNKSMLRDFIASYYFGLFIRFVVLLALFVAILLITKIDEMSFTVSFIISYILHSVNEVIFLNQKLTD